MHDHQHDHGFKISEVNRALVIGIVLNIIFVLIEVTAGVWYHSLALLSDAGHNLSDVMALVVALGAIKLLSIEPTKNYTYGFRKTTIWAALFNALFLFVAVGVILWESIHRWIDPVPIDGQVTAIVAGIGIVINGVTAWLFVKDKDKDKDLNIKGAYLHMLADTLVSVGVVLSGLLIWATGWHQVDTIMSWVIVAVILISTWKLFKDTVQLSLDGIPNDLEREPILQKIRNTTGVRSVHHVHIWALSTTENALTAHVVIDKNCSFEDARLIKKEIRHILEHENIQHVTLELEKEGEDCPAYVCNIIYEQEAHHHHHH